MPISVREPGPGLHPLEAPAQGHSPPPYYPDPRILQPREWAAIWTDLEIVTPGEEIRQKKTSVI